MVIAGGAELILLTHVFKLGQTQLNFRSGDIADHLTFGMSRTEQPDVSDVCGSFYFNADRQSSTASNAVSGSVASPFSTLKSGNPSAIVVDLPQLSPQLTSRKQSGHTKLGSPADSGIFEFDGF